MTYPNHAVYGELKRHPPTGVAYSVFGATPAQQGRTATGRLAALRRAAAGYALKNAAGLRLYQQAKCRAVSAGLGGNSAAGLWHCCGHLGGTGAPWIGDYENVNVLSLYDPHGLRSPRYREFLEERLAGDQCRAIRVWSPWAARSFEAAFPGGGVRRKLATIYPTLGGALPETPAEPREERPHLLFVGRGFWSKGGKLFLDAVDRLRKDCDFAADFVCDLPAECEPYRERLAGRVSFHEPTFRREELARRFYSSADVLVMLGMADSYGLTLIEASAYGLPIVAFRLHSGLSDLLALTGNAVQVEPRYQIFGADGVHRCSAAELRAALRKDPQEEVVERLRSALGGLLSDRALRRRLGERGRGALERGPLAAETMRQSMGALYRESVAR